MTCLNKKGIVFTVLSLVIGSFILIIFFQMIELPPDNKVDVTRTKVRQVNNLLDQSTDLIRTQAIISSKQSISSMIDVMYTRNDFISDFDEAFEDCLINGEFEFDASNNYSCGEHSNLKYMIETNLSSFLLENMDLPTVFTLSNVSLNQSDPWFLDISFDVNVLVDEDDYFWNVSEDVSEKISILNFKDPLKASVNNTVRHHRPSINDIPKIKVHNSYNNLSSDWREKPSTLNRLARDDFYFEYNNSIKFLDKLRGNLTPSDLGIVSVVPVIRDSSDDVVRSGRTSLDWHFWQGVYGSSVYGSYYFEEPDEIVEMLEVTNYNNLEDERTIHETYVPVDLAVAANMSGSSYFTEESD